MAYIKMELLYFIGNIIKKNFFLQIFIVRLLLFINRLYFIIPHEKDYLGLKHIKLDDEKIILDIGANNGLSSLSFFGFGFKGNIIAFEPNPFHEKDLKKIKRKFPNFSYYILGASDKESESKLFVPKYKNIPVTPLGSSNKKYLEYSLTRDFPRIYKQFKIHEVKINLKPLDDFNFAPTFIKIDTEGNDFKVIKGLEKTIIEHRPIILVEYTPNYFNEIFEFLVNLKYMFFLYKDKRFIKINNEKDLNNIYFEKNLQTNIYCSPYDLIT